jgi:GNAT superfamily N-acetyltransferase
MRPAVDIRPYRVSDGPAVTALAAAAWPGDAVMQELQATHGPDRDSPLRRVVVAEWDGELAGAACVTASNRHPSRHTLVLHVAPRFRRRGVGSALLARMRAATAASGLPLRTRARPSDASSTAFLVARGFRVLVRVRTGVIDPAAPAVRRRVEALAHPPPGTRLLPFDGAESTASVDDCAGVLRSVYADTHGWDPPAPWPADQVREHFCGSELVAGSMVCAYQDAALAGVGILLSLGNAALPDAWYLSDVGVAGQDRPHARELTGALAAHCLEHAGRNRRMVEFEVDDSHAHLWAVLETVSVVSASTDLVIMADDPGVS